MKRYAWVTLVVASSCGVPEGPVSPTSETVTDRSAIARHGGTLAVGGMEACTRRGDGYWCWGTSDEAGFGRSGGCANGVFCETAWRVPELDRAVQVVFSPIGKACLVNRDGQLWCRGAVTAPGRGKAARATTRWQFDAPVVDVALGGGFFCVRHPSGTVSCWGDVIFRNGPAPARPGPVLGLADATQLAAGSQHACALRQNGRSCVGDRIAPVSSVRRAIPPVRRAMSRRASSFRFWSKDSPTSRSYPPATISRARESAPAPFSAGASIKSASSAKWRPRRANLRSCRSAGAKARAAAARSAFAASTTPCVSPAGLITAAPSWRRVASFVGGATFSSSSACLHPRSARPTGPSAMRAALDRSTSVSPTWSTSR